MLTLEQLIARRRVVFINRIETEANGDVDISRFDRVEHTELSEQSMKPQVGVRSIQPA